MSLGIWPMFEESREKKVRNAHVATSLLESLKKTSISIKIRFQKREIWWIKGVMTQKRPSDERDIFISTRWAANSKTVDIHFCISFSPSFWKLSLQIILNDANADPRSSTSEKQLEGEIDVKIAPQCFSILLEL